MWWLQFHMVFVRCIWIAVEGRSSWKFDGHKAEVCVRHAWHCATGVFNTNLCVQHVAMKISSGPPHGSLNYSCNSIVWNVLDSRNTAVSKISSGPLWRLNYSCNSTVLNVLDSRNTAVSKISSGPLWRLNYSCNSIVWNVLDSNNVAVNKISSGPLYESLN